MALVGLKRASELTGKNQSTIHRAMKAGRLSFTTSEAGERLIDTAELHRVFPIKPPEEEQGRNDAPELQSNVVQLAELRLKLSLEGQKISMLEARIAELEEIKADLREDRDRWRTQAEQSTRLLTGHGPKDEAEASANPKKSFFSRLFG